MRTQPDDDPVVESARIKNAESHLAMADRCLKVLGGHSALARYANQCWPEHAKQCGEAASPWIVENSHFFGERSEHRSRWWPIYKEASQYTHRRLLRENLDPPKLHMACFIGFTQWVEHILTSKRRLLKPRRRSINHCGKGLATPLHFAVHAFNSETVEYLLRGVLTRISSSIDCGVPFTTQSCALTDSRRVMPSWSVCLLVAPTSISCCVKR